MTESDWLSSEDAAALLEWVTKSSLPRLMNVPPGDRKLRLFACACCRRVWHLLTDPRSRNTVEVAERYADGLATGEDLSVARANAQEAPAWIASNDDASVAARRISGCSGIPGKAALLRDIVGNPYRPVTLPKRRPHCPHCGAERWTVIAVDEMACLDCLKRWPWPADAYTCPWLTWNDGLVTRLARAAYEERLKCHDCGGTGRIEDGTLCPERLGVLADALEEAGCQDEAILGRLRARPHVHESLCYDGSGLFGPRVLCCDMAESIHVRGCWVLDLLLGKC